MRPKNSTPMRPSTLSRARRALLGAAVAAALGSAVGAPAAWAAAEGPGTPQSKAANAGFLATWPAPAGGAAGVCVIDSGVDTDTDLGPALGARSAFDGGTLGDTGAEGDEGTPLSKHGTYVAGIIGSQIDGVGTNGIWPASKILSRRVFAGPTSRTTAQDYIRAIQWCLQDATRNVRVVNLSLSGLSATLEERQALEDKIAQVRQAPYNVNVVAAAGNNGLTQVGYPAAGPGVFAVGAIDATGAFWEDSNRGTGLDISTLGTGVCLTLSYGSRLAFGAGTSYAAPTVSAVLAALRSSRPDLTPDQAEQLLLDSADGPAGAKRLNAAKAFLAAGLLTADEAARTYPGNACEPPPEPGGGGGGGASSGGGGGGGAAAKAPQNGTPAEAPSAPAPDVVVPAPLVDVQLPAVDPFEELRPVKPTLRSLTFRQSILTVKVAGYRPGQQAIFRVDQRVRVGAGARKRWKTSTRTYTRSSGLLRLRVDSWTSVRVQLRAPGIGSSKTLTIRRSAEF